MPARPLTPIFDPKIRYGKIRPAPTFQAPSAGFMSDTRDTAAGTALHVPPSGGLLYDALLALSPTGMWPFRESGGTTVADVSTNANDGTYYNIGGAVNLAAKAGPDGASYPTITDTGTFRTITLPDLAGYSRGASGITVAMMVFVSTGMTYDGVVMRKGNWNNGALEEWEVNLAVSTGILAKTYDASMNTARQRYSTTGLTSNAWNFVIVRFSSTATAYPALRVGGTNLSGFTGGSGSAGGGTAANLNVGSGAGGGNNMLGRDADAAVALGTIIDGNLSDAQCGALEAIAVTEGWY